MKLSASRRRNTPSEEAEEVLDIDVTPVMNMFVILIPFLISMAVFAHFSTHKFYLPTDAASARNNQTEKVLHKTTLVLTPTTLRITLAGKMIDSLSFTDVAWQEKSTKSLISVRRQSDDTLKAVIAVDDAVAFEQVVSMMDLCRSLGFVDVGLSERPSIAPQGAK